MIGRAKGSSRRRRRGAGVCPSVSPVTIPYATKGNCGDPAVSGMDSQAPSSTAALPPRFGDLAADIPVYPVARIAAVRLHTGAPPDAPDIVVVMRPKDAQPAVVVPHPSPEEEIVSSPERRFQARDEGTAQDERLCIQAWALCAAVTFPLVFSAWLLLVPYVAHISGVIPAGGGRVFTLPTYPSQSVPAPTFSMPPSRPSLPLPTFMTRRSNSPPHPPSAFTGRTYVSRPATVTSSSTMVPPSATGPVTYLSPSTPVAINTTTTDVPRRCLNPASVRAPPAVLRAGPRHNGTHTNLPSRRFFCVYDNHYVVRGTTSWHFMFETLPFALCPYVIYSSVGIVDGTLTSRLPSFDRQHGLHQLRNITDRLGFPRIKILLTLGSYPEDSPHFSRLGRDTALMARLMRSVVTAMTDYRLNGVTVDWTEPHVGCGANNDTDVLRLLLRNIRQSFDRYRMNHIISVVLRPDRVFDTIANNVAHVVNYFFVGKQFAYPAGSALTAHFCSQQTSIFHAEIRELAQNAPRVGLDQLCIVEKVVPIVTNGVMDLRTGSVTNSNANYAGNFYDVCHLPGFCRNDSSAGSCVSHFMFNAAGTPTSRPVKYISSSSSRTLRDRADLSRLRGPTGSTPYRGPCVLALHLHKDNFASQCGPRYNQYILTEHLYYATLGQNATGGSLLNATTAC